MSAAAGIPQQFGLEFLEWLRVATERAWSEVAEETLADFQRAGVGGVSWCKGTRWTGGLSAAEIDEAEQRFGLEFPADYRTFLQVLHATAPPMRGASFLDEKNMGPIERPAFFDWRRDDEAIRAAQEWPFEGLLFDVEHNALWPAGWGERPVTAENRSRRLKDLVANAPKLVPVVGHRYLVAVEPHVVLSVYQSDMIVYGNDLRTFLLNELSSLLGMPRDDVSLTATRATAVPFWGELVETA